MRYSAPAGFTYPGSIDRLTYAGNNMLFPCRTIRVEPTMVQIPPELVGKRLRVEIVLREDK